jgi:hypothetical protein
MFKPHKNTCQACKKETIVVVEAMLCAKCNYDQKQAKRKSAGKKPSKPFQSYAYKEPTGEAELFAEIAETREWVCFVSGEPLYELKPNQFLHVLPKALNKYPKYKLYAKNVILASDDIHIQWDFSPRSELTDPIWEPLFKLEAELKQQYPNII